MSPVLVFVPAMPLWGAAPVGCVVLPVAWVWAAGSVVWLAPSAAAEEEEPSDCLFRKPEACWVSLLKSIVVGGGWGGGIGRRLLVIG